MVWNFALQSVSSGVFRVRGSERTYGFALHLPLSDRGDRKSSERGSASDKSLSRDQRRYQQACRIIFAGCVGWGFPHRCTDGLLVLPPFRSVRRKSGYSVLSRTPPERALSLGSGVARASYRPCQNNGFYSPSLQPVPACSTVCALLQSGGGAAPLPRGAGGDGCPDTSILRCGRGPTE